MALVLVTFTSLSPKERKKKSGQSLVPRRRPQWSFSSNGSGPRRPSFENLSRDCSTDEVRVLCFWKPFVHTHTQRSSLLISLAFLDVIKLTTETNCQKILLKRLTMPRQMVYPRNQHLDASEPKSKTLANHMCFDHIESCKAQSWLLVSLLWPFPVSGSHLTRDLKKSFV